MEKDIQKINRITPPEIKMVRREEICLDSVKSMGAKDVEWFDNVELREEFISKIDFIKCITESLQLIEPHTDIYSYLSKIYNQIMLEDDIDGTNNL